LLSKVRSSTHTVSSPVLVRNRCPETPTKSPKSSIWKSSNVRGLHCQVSRKSAVAGLIRRCARNPLCRAGEALRCARPPAPGLWRPRAPQRLPKYIFSTSLRRGGGPIETYAGTRHGLELRSRQAFSGVGDIGRAAQKVTGEFSPREWGAKKLERQLKPKYSGKGSGWQAKPSLARCAMIRDLQRGIWVGEVRAKRAAQRSRTVREDWFRLAFLRRWTNFSAPPETNSNAPMEF